VDELHRRLVRRVREFSRERKIPVSHLPDRAGVSRSHFWEVVGGRKSPTLKWLGKVAKALEVDPSALVTPPRK
jgi:transcriptional regulator with XRE-family HTH domain